MFAYKYGCCFSTIKYFWFLLSNTNNSTQYKSFVCRQGSRNSYRCLRLFYSTLIIHVWTREKWQWMVTPYSPAGGLLSYPGHVSWYLSAETPSVYSTAPADWTVFITVNKKPWKRREKGFYLFILFCILPIPI